MTEEEKAAQLALRQFEFEQNEHELVCKLRDKICYGLKATLEKTIIPKNLPYNSLTTTQLGALSNAVIVTVQFEFARLIHERNNNFSKKLDKKLF